VSIINRINARLKRATCAHVHRPHGEREFCPDPEIPIYEMQELMRCDCGDEHWATIMTKKKWHAPIRAKEGYRYVIGKSADTGELHPTRVTLAEAKACGESYDSYKECAAAIKEQNERFQRNNRES